MMTTFFTAWGYQVSYLEFMAALAGAIGVWYGTTTKRVTWPWWIFSSALYGIFFWKVDLVASALLQIVFYSRRNLGLVWLGSKRCKKPSKLTSRELALWSAGLIVAWLIFTPWLHSIESCCIQNRRVNFLRFICSSSNYGL
jgi:nicotinamide mononucleotide transporter